MHRRRLITHVRLAARFHAGRDPRRRRALELALFTDPPLSLRVIAARVGLPRSTVFGLVSGFRRRLSDAFGGGGAQ